MKTKSSLIIEGLRMVSEDTKDEVLIGKTDNFSAYQYSIFVKLVDLSGNYTVFTKQELKEMIDLLKKCYSKI